MALNPLIFVCNWRDLRGTSSGVKLHQSTSSLVHFELHCIHAYSQTKVEFLAKGSLHDNSGFKIVAITHCYFTRLNLKKMGPL